MHQNSPTYNMKKEECNMHPCIIRVLQVKYFCQVHHTHYCSFLATLRKKRIVFVLDFRIS